MLNWIRRKILNRRRAIYRYYDGQRLRRADPMVLHRSLVSHKDFDLGTHPQFIDDSIEDREITLNAIREIFDVKAFDGETGEGLTEEETINLLWAFVRYCHAKKKNTNPSPTSPLDTDTEPPEDVPDESTTKPLSESGSTSVESRPDTQPA